MANEFKIKKGLIVTGASGGTVVNVLGSQGQLLSVTDNLSGSIFAVSDISGVPILDVNSNGLMTIDGPLTQTGGGDSNFSGDVNIKSVFDFDTATDLFSITNNQNTGGINLSGNNSRIYFGGNRAIEGAQGGTNLTLAEGYTTTYIQSNTIVQGTLAISATIPKLSFTDLQQDDWDIINDNGEFKFLCSTGTGVALQLNTDNSATFGTQAFATTATSSGDASSTLTTKGYVDSLITGATIYRGTWDPDVSLNSGYGNPNLNTVTQTSGYYYICSADGTATPNGTGNEPNTWSTGDWVIWNDDIGTSGEWQKVDNSSVLSGVGTGQTVALWEGASSVTDSETLGNAPITVSGSNTTFGGDVNALRFNMNLGYAASNEYLVIAKAQSQDGGIILKSKPAGGNAQNDWQILNHASTGDLRFYAYGLGGFALTLDRQDGNATFASNVAVTGTSSTFNTGNSGTFVTNDANNYPRLTMTNASAQLGLFRAGGNSGGMYIGAAGDGFRLYTTSFAQKLLVDQSGNATFAGNISAQDLLLPDGADVAWDGGYGSSKPVLAANGTTMKMYPSGVTSGVQFSLSPTLATFGGDVVVDGGELKVKGNFAKILLEDTAGTDLDAYIVNNANGLFFGKTNSPSASNDILSLNLSTKAATFAGNVGIGTTSPASTLHVLGPNAASGGITLSSGTSNNTQKSR